jgi:hypothetical protein
MATKAKLPRIVVKDNYYKRQVGKFAEKMAEETIAHPNSWLELLGASACVEAILDLPRQHHTFNRLSRQGAVPPTLAFQGNQNLRAAGPVFEGYKIAILTASEHVQNALAGVEQQSLGEADRRSINRLVQKVKSSQKDFERDLIAITDPERLQSLFERYGHTAHHYITELCSKLLVNLLRGYIEQLILFELPDWRKGHPKTRL